MTFVSYAQNFEDVVLWRALKNVDKGFYIDVGANDPKLHSTTKAFYDRGWRGINIEPAPDAVGHLRQRRPEDINLQLVAARAKDNILFYHIKDTGLSTTDRQIADQHREAGLDVEKVEVEADTLANICATHVHGEVHFLKVDVEGGTLAVIAGADFRRVRPWIILVEATLPMSQVDDYADWEPMILESGYDFVYADGLNRFYLAQEHASLAARFKYPPNVFDDFVLSSWQDATHTVNALTQRVLAAEADTRSLLASAEQAHLGRVFTEQVERTRAAEERAHRSESQAATLQQAFDAQVERTRAAEERAYRSLAGGLTRDEFTAAASARLQERERLLRAIYESSSWRITAPLRALASIVPGKRRQAATLSAAASRPRRPTIFIECTHTYHSDLNTGIQRVVRNILRHAPVVARRLGYDVVPVIFDNDQFVFADAARVLADKQRIGPPAIETKVVIEEAEPPPATSVRIRHALRPAWSLLRRTLAVMLPFDAAREFIYAPLDRPGLLRCIIVPIRLLRGTVQRPAPKPAPLPRHLDDFESCDGSILLLLDSSWTIDLWPAVAHFKRRGGTIVGVIYDLIPITHSNTSIAELSVAFTDWMRNHLHYSNAFACISRSVARQLKDFLALDPDTRALAERLPIGHFHLGSELDFVTSGEPVRAETHAIFAGDQPLFITVGSIEPRKNHAFVLNAFDKFWERGGSAVLVIIGRQGWRTENVLERIAQHDQLGRQLFLLRDLTDAELDHAYRNASALVIASEIEGFGLPIVEAFQRGLPVLCSDIPVFREIADGRATFFGLDNPNNLTDVLEAFCRAADPTTRRQRKPQHWINWSESTQQLLEWVVSTEKRAVGPLRNAD